MPHAEHQTAIRRPIGEVFAYLADGEKCTEWRSGVLSVKKVCGDGVGAQYQQSVRGPGGRPISADYTITELSPSSVIAFETTSGPVRPRGRFTLAEEDGTTTVTFSLDAEMTGVKKLLMGGMVQKSMASEVRALDNVKPIMEATGQ